jgi:hypothetical protein
VLAELLEHLREPDRLVSEARRVLRPVERSLARSRMPTGSRTACGFSPESRSSPTQRTCTCSVPRMFGRC